MKRRRDDKIFLIRFASILLLVVGLITMGGCFMMDLDGDDGDEDDGPRWFRDLRIDAWSHIIGDESGLLSVKQKLETMYGRQAPKIKVDLANSEFSEGNWHYEFVQLAEQSLANNDYLAATGYYTAAAYPEMYQDTRAHELYDLALSTFEQALQKHQYPYKIVAVNVDGINIDAYLVYPQSYTDGDVVPAILETGGIDGLMLFQFADYMLHWNEANIAWVGFDIAGLGTSRNLNLTYEVEKVHVAVIKALKADASIDHKNIFVYSRSMGGTSALRLIGTGQADKLDIAGVAAVCPLTASTVKGGWLAGLIAIKSIPTMTRNALGASLGIDPDDTWELSRGARTLQASFQGYWGKTVTSVPLLVCTGEHMDFANSTSDLQIAANISEKGKYIVAEGESGHCPGLQGTLNEVAKFVNENMR